MKNLNMACCFSGHRIEKISCSMKWLESALLGKIDQALTDGFDTFYHGGCNGVDLIAAEQVLLRRFVAKPSDPVQIYLIGVLPFEGQANNWNEHWRDRYYNVLSKCDEVITLHTTFSRGYYQERNKYMVDHSQRLIAVYDGVSAGGTRNTIRYAQQRKIDIQTIEYSPQMKNDEIER